MSQTQTKTSGGDTMKACKDAVLDLEERAVDCFSKVHYEGAFKVSVRSIPLPKIEHPDDVIVKVTTAAICGSDLHMYQGRTAAEPGIVFGHEK